MKKDDLNSLDRLLSWISKNPVKSSISLILVIIIIPFIILPFFLTRNAILWSFAEPASWVGNTIGGISGPIIALFGACLTFLAFYIQYIANKIQNRRIDIQQFEAVFFQMLNIHRENVQGLNNLFNENKKQTIFSVFIEEFKFILGIVENNYKENDEKKRNLANIAFLILMYGLNKEKYLIDNKLSQYSKDELEKIFKEIRKFDNNVDDGYTIILSNYFRHMIRLVRYTNGNEHLTDEQKKKYLKIFRAQLSDDEQVILFLDSISDIGKGWELKYREIDQRQCLITNYELIKHMPVSDLSGLDPRKYYTINYDNI